MKLLKKTYFPAEDFDFREEKTCDTTNVEFIFGNIERRLNNWPQPLQVLRKYLTGVVVTWISYVPDQNGEDFHFDVHETFFPCQHDCVSFPLQPRLPIVPEYSYNISVSFETPVSKKMQCLRMFMMR